MVFFYIPYPPKTSPESCSLQSSVLRQSVLMYIKKSIWSGKCVIIFKSLKYVLFCRLHLNHASNDSVEKRKERNISQYALFHRKNFLKKSSWSCSILSYRSAEAPFDIGKETFQWQPKEFESFHATGCRRGLNFGKTIRQSIWKHEKESLTDVWASTLNL